MSTNLFWKYSDNKSILECGISTRPKHDREKGILDTNAILVETHGKKIIYTEKYEMALSSQSRLQKK